MPVARQEAAAGVRERADAAVERRLMSDVPLGAFLSGGLDSTIVVGLMSRMMSRAGQDLQHRLRGRSRLRRDRVRAAGGEAVQDRPHRISRHAVGHRSDRHAGLAPRRPVRRLVRGANLSGVEADARAGDGRADRRRRRRTVRGLSAVLRRHAGRAYSRAGRPGRARRSCRVCRRLPTIVTGSPGPSALRKRWARRFTIA